MRFVLGSELIRMFPFVCPPNVSAHQRPLTDARGRLVQPHMIGRSPMPEETLSWPLHTIQE
jgi:hypothetical protein